jgi:hypothetical protein
MLWEIMSWNRIVWGRLAVSNVCVLAQTEQTRVQWLRPEKKEVSPYIPLQAGYRSKKQSSTHMWLYWLFHFPSVMWPSCFNLYVLSLCFAISSPCLIIRTQPFCFFSGLPFLATKEPWSLLWSTQKTSKEGKYSKDPYLIEFLWNFLCMYV